MDAEENSSTATLAEIEADLIDRVGFQSKDDKQQYAEGDQENIRTIDNSSEAAETSHNE